MSGKLVIARHGESEWNALGKWTGITDVHLTTKGFYEAALMGELIKDIKFDQAYASQQMRTLETLEGILDGAAEYDVPYEQVGAINERDYGDLTGKNKWEVKEEVGEEAFNGIRRGWDFPVSNGETLKMVYNRVVPFYKDTILSKLIAGKTVLLVGHGNSIRSLMKYLEDINDADIADTEFIFGTILIYEVNEHGRMTTKASRAIKTELPPA